MAEAIVKADHLELVGKKYFRVGAEDVQVGSYGRKKLDAIPFHLPKHPKGDHVEVMSTLKLDGLKPHQVTTVDIDYKHSDKFTAAGKGQVQVGQIPVKVTAAASGSHEKAQEDKLKLFKLVLDMGEIVGQLNKDQPAIDAMLELGKDGRIVHEVFVVVSATLADSIDGSASASFGGGSTVPTVNISANVKASGSKTEKTNLTLEKGQVFAYSTLRFSEKALKEFHAKKPTSFNPAHFTEDQYGKDRH
jgi:hypothetical protein